MLTDERLTELWVAASSLKVSIKTARWSFARAVEREVLEEALLVCGHLRWHPPWQMGAQECVDAIRALIDKEPRT